MHFDDYNYADINPYILVTKDKTKNETPGSGPLAFKR